MVYKPTLAIIVNLSGAYIVEDDSGGRSIGGVNGHGLVFWRNLTPFIKAFLGEKGNVEDKGEGYN